MNPKSAPQRRKRRLVAFSAATTFVTLCLTGAAAALSNSSTLLSDFLKCLVEFFAIAIACVVVQKTDQADQSAYNYGFGKLEQLSSTIVALALSCAGVLCVVSAVRRVYEPDPLQNPTFGLVLAILSVGGNAILWSYFRWLSKKEPSPVLSSQSSLFRSKAFASAIVVLSLVASITTKDPLYSAWFDAIGSLSIALFLFISAFSIASDSVAELVDRSLEEAFQLQILKVLVTHESEYAGYHGMRSRRTGRDFLIELFLEFEDESSMKRIRSSIELIQSAVRSAIPNSEVLIVPSWKPIESFWE